MMDKRFLIIGVVVLAVVAGCGRDRACRVPSA
jgi:hypothetical protein